MYATAASLEGREALVRRFLSNREELKRRQVEHKLLRQQQGELFERASAPVVDAGEAAEERASQELAQAKEAINERQDRQIRELRGVTDAVEAAQGELGERLDALTLASQAGQAEEGGSEGSRRSPERGRGRSRERRRGRPPERKSAAPSLVALRNLEEAKSLKAAAEAGAMVSEEALIRLARAAGGGQRAAVPPASRGVHAQTGKIIADVRKMQPRGLRGARRGTGVRYYKGPDELVERLHLCCGSALAGNDSKELKNEIEEILTTLLADGDISKGEYRAIRSKYAV